MHGVNTRRIGDLGERIAEAFLVLKGYEIIRRNVRYAGREIDLLARKGRVLAAVEVKLRVGRNFGAAIEAVDGRKISRIRTALGGLLSGFEEPVEPRIDLVVIDFGDELGEMTLRHVEAVG